MSSIHEYLFPQLIYCWVSNEEKLLIILLLVFLLVVNKDVSWDCLSQLVTILFIGLRFPRPTKTGTQTRKRDHSLLLLYLISFEFQLDCHRFWRKSRSYPSFLFWSIHSLLYEKVLDYDPIASWQSDCQWWSWRPSMWCIDPFGHFDSILRKSIIIWGDQGERMAVNPFGYNSKLLIDE